MQSVRFVGVGRPAQIQEAVLGLSRRVDGSDCDGARRQDSRRDDRISTDGSRRRLREAEGRTDHWARRADPRVVRHVRVARGKCDSRPAYAGAFMMRCCSSATGVIERMSKRSGTVAAEEECIALGAAERQLDVCRSMMRCRCDND